MRVGVITWGTEGDVRPFAALAHGLVRAGHDVTLVYTSIDGRDWSAQAETSGFRAVRVGEAYVSSHREETERRLYYTVLHEGPLKQVEAISGMFVDPLEEEMFASAQALCRENDVIVGHFLHHPAACAAAGAHTPFIAVFTAPAMPSTTYAPIGLPTWLPRTASWWLLRKVGNHLFLGRANALRAKHGVPLLGSVLDDAAFGVPGMLTAISPTLFPRPPDWPATHEVPGFLNLPDAAVPWDMPLDLARFLDEKPAPVFMTFGSMMSMADQETQDGARLLVDTARVLGRRAIIQAPWDKLGDVVVTDHVYRLTRAPHARILPRCAALVHHGGAGTTQSACLAGIPCVVLPYVGDQWFWGERLRSRGMAPRPLRRFSATPKKLAARIQEVLDTPSMTQRAAETGALLAREDGVGRAVAHIEKLMARH